MTQQDHKLAQEIMHDVMNAIERTNNWEILRAVLSTVLHEIDESDPNRSAELFVFYETHKLEVNAAVDANINKRN